MVHVHNKHSNNDFFVHIFHRKYPENVIEITEFFFNLEYY